MSYDIELVDPVTRKVIKVDGCHNIRGGTYAVGGTNCLHLNITYNYGGYFRQVFGELGIRALYEKPAAEVMRMLVDAINQLKGNADKDYWAPTEGNARKALVDLLTLVAMAPADAMVIGD